MGSIILEMDARNGSWNEMDPEVDAMSFPIEHTTSNFNDKIGRLQTVVYQLHPTDIYLI